MDGLLVDSETTWHEVEIELLAARGKAYDEDTRAGLVGLRMDEFTAKLKTLFNLPESPEELERELVGRMLDLIPKQVRSQPGAEELVAFVAKHNIPRAIASSSPMSIIDATVQARGWLDIFTLRCSASEDARGKPAPDVYLRAARLLNVEPSRCLALEDSPNGARAAVAAGMTCFAVPDFSHTAKSSFDGITHHLFDNLHTVLARLNGK
jgi:HAD superfamily hydrolase (TIGR01509 family)